MSATPTDPGRVPRRFQRRLLGIMLIAGLVPAVSLEAARRYVLATVPDVSFEPIRATLERAEQGLEAAGPHPALAQEMRDAERDLVQAELARPHLPSLIASRALPWVLAAELILVGVAIALGRRLGRPIQSLTDGMARLGRGQLDARIAPPAGPEDELGYLVRRFNAMADELAASRARLATTEKLAAWQDVARGMAHDLKNPLTAMRMALGRLARVGGEPARAGDEPGRDQSSSARTAAAVSGAARGGGDRGAALRESLELLEDEVGVLQRMAESFSAFARLPEPRLAPLDLGALVGEVAALYRDNPAGVRVESEDLPSLTVAADADQLRRAIGNLVKNAIEATAQAAAGTAVEIGLAQGSGRALLRVRDRGAGVSALLEGAALARGLGSTKKGGSGLGLPLATKIVHDHAGTLRLVPCPDGGTEAVIDLPLVGPTARA